jgi:dihydrodipicolinate synthase/N-acetylneuraminate lyase
MHMMGMIEKDVRLPLTPPGEAVAAKIRKALADYGLL